MTLSAVLVTGAAGALGKALTERLLSAGTYEVVIALVRPGTTMPDDRMRGAVLKPLLETVECDLEDLDGLERCVRPLTQRFEIRALVNNAAVLAYERLDVETARRVFATNVLGPLELIRVLSLNSHLRAVLHAWFTCQDINLRLSTNSFFFHVRLHVTRCEVSRRQRLPPPPATTHHRCSMNSSTCA